MIRGVIDRDPLEHLQRAATLCTLRALSHSARPPTSGDTATRLESEQYGTGNPGGQQLGRWKDWRTSMGAMAVYDRSSEVVPQPRPGWVFTFEQYDSVRFGNLASACT